MMEIIASLFGRVLQGEVPEQRETVADCLVHLAAAAIGEFMEGTTPVGQELDHLVKALQNPADSTVRGLNPAAQMMLRMQLPKLVEAKEQMVRHV